MQDDLVFFLVSHFNVLSSKEEAKRFMVFCENMDKVKEYQRLDQGSAIYGATKFADMTGDLSYEIIFKNLFTVVFS